MKKDDIFGGVILLIVIAAIGLFLYFAKSAPELNYGPVEIPGSAIMGVTTMDGYVQVTVATKKPGYITLHRSIGGAPGSIVGISGLVSIGDDWIVPITPSEILEKGLTYIALLHVDNGDGIFRVNDDMPVVSNDVSVRSDFVAP